MSQTRSPSLEMIADAAGVSRNTVARALNGTTKKAWASTAKRVQEIRKIAEDMGYRPSGSARAIRTGRTGVIDLLLSANTQTSRLPDELLAGIHNSLEEHDLILTISRLSDGHIQPKDLMPRILREQVSDGLLINYTHAVDEQILSYLKNYAIPAIWLNADQKFDTIRTNETQAAFEATTKMIQAGHRRISYAWWYRSGHYSETARQQGYEKAMNDAGLKPDVQQIGDVTFSQIKYGSKEDDRLASAYQLLSKPDRPTAIIPYSSSLIGVLMVAAAQCQLQIPHDLSICTFSDSCISQIGKQIDAYVIPQRKMGMMAVSMLLEKIASPKKQLDLLSLPMDYFSFGTIVKPCT